MDGRARPQCMAARHIIHPKCQGLPGSLESLPGVPQSHDEGELTGRMAVDEGRG